MEATALRGNGDVPEAILEIEGKVVYAAEMCEKHVPILAALQFGRDVLAKQIENGFDLTAFTDSAKRYARAVAEHPLPEAVRHFYRKSGLTGDLAERTYQTVRNILALFAAWAEHKHDSSLGLPDRLDLVGWHGFILQTREYADFCNKLGYFARHATTEGGQASSSLLTMALFDHVFGEINVSIWQDTPGFVIFGWCSCDND